MSDAKQAAPTSYIGGLVDELTELRRLSELHDRLMNSLYPYSMSIQEIDVLKYEQATRVQRIKDIERQLSKIFAGCVALVGFKLL